MKRREIFWLIGITALIFLLNLILFGIHGFNSNAVIDINVHDTYYVISNFHFMILVGSLVFFIVYLIRTLNHRFRNLTASIILMISIIVFSIMLTGINTILDTYIQQTESWTIYPPLSAVEAEHEIEPKSNNLSILSSVLFYFKIALLIFLAYSGFKTGQNYKFDY